MIFYFWHPLTNVKLQLEGYGKYGWLLPGPQNKLIVSPPAAQRGKCFPSEGMLTINSS